MSQQDLCHKILAADFKNQYLHQQLLGGNSTRRRLILKNKFKIHIEKSYQRNNCLSKED